MVLRRSAISTGAANAMVAKQRYPPHSSSYALPRYARFKRMLQRSRRVFAVE